MNPSSCSTTHPRSRSSAPPLPAWRCSERSGPGSASSGAELRRGDEAPKHVFGRATFGTLLVLGVVYILVTYAFVIGWGTNHVAQGVDAQFKGLTISAFYPLTTPYAGPWLTDAFKMLIITSSFACQLAFFNTTGSVPVRARPRAPAPSRARTHPRQAQHAARRGDRPVRRAVIYIGAFVLSDPSTIAALTQLATWSPFLGVLGILGVGPRPRSRSFATSGRSTGLTSTRGGR